MDGYLWPYAFNIADFEPITGRVHQPPPVHQTFCGAELRRLLVGAAQVRLPPARDPCALQPLEHQLSTRLINDVAGNFMSRRGVGIASFTLHPGRVSRHGPHPGTAEASIGKEATEELAVVMVDTFHPLKITRQAADLEDGRYPLSTAPSRRRLRRGPRAEASAGRRRSRS